MNYESFYSFQALKKRTGKLFMFADKKDLVKKIESYLKSNHLNLHDFQEIGDGHFYNFMDDVVISTYHWEWDGKRYHTTEFNILWN